jgi:hypothetical protein
MAVNYAVMAVTAILFITGIIGMLRGAPERGHPFRAIAAGIVFVIALVATLKGLSYVEVKIMIESALGGR